MKKNILSFLLIVALFIGISFAHQPRLVSQTAGEKPVTIQVQNPEISQAFYGELKGSADTYEINAQTGILLYLQLTVPAISGARTDFIAKATYGNNKTLLLDGTQYARGMFYEEFGGDTYFSGPSLEQIVEPGKITITVSNSDNQGKYVLAIGKIESFPPSEIAKATINMPKIKLYFGESPFTAFFNLSGLFLGILLVLTVLIVLIVVIIIRKRRHKKSK